MFHFHVYFSIFAQMFISYILTIYLLILVFFIFCLPTQQQLRIRVERFLENLFYTCLVVPNCCMQLPKYKILLLNYTFELGAGPQSASEKFDCYHKMGQQKKNKTFLEPAPGKNIFLDFFIRLRIKRNSKNLCFSFDQVKTVMPILGA